MVLVIHWPWITRTKEVIFMTPTEQDLLTRLYDYTCELEKLYSVRVLTRPYMAQYPGTLESRTALGKAVCEALGRDWPPK